MAERRELGVAAGTMVARLPAVDALLPVRAVLEPVHSTMAVEVLARKFCRGPQRDPASDVVIVGALGHLWDHASDAVIVGALGHLWDHASDAGIEGTLGHLRDHAGEAGIEGGGALGDGGLYHLL
jgi:hypothetical protein